MLVEARLGGNPGLAVEPSLEVEHPEGGFSDEMLKLYGKEQRLPQAASLHESPLRGKKKSVSEENL